MSTTQPRQTMFVPTMEEVPRISDPERAALRESLELGRAQIAAGDCDVLRPGDLRKEFEAILRDDLSDEALDALLGIAPPTSG